MHSEGKKHLKRDGYPSMINGQCVLDSARQSFRFFACCMFVFCLSWLPNAALCSQNACSKGEKFRPTKSQYTNTQLLTWFCRHIKIRARLQPGSLFFWKELTTWWHQELTSTCQHLTRSSTYVQSKTGFRISPFQTVAWRKTNPLHHFESSLACQWFLTRLKHRKTWRKRFILTTS